MAASFPCGKGVFRLYIMFFDLVNFTPPTPLLTPVLPLLYMASSRPLAEMASSRPFAESEPLDKPGDGLWQHYLTTVEAEDLADVESWNGSTTGILTFVRPLIVVWHVALTFPQTGLFAATVATFVIESYQALTPDTGAQTVALLYQLVSTLR